MINFKTQIQKFGKNGEKTGWTFIDIPKNLAEKIKPNCKKSFRVKGKIDEYLINMTAVIPIGNGDFILPINATIRKAIKKIHGALVVIQLEEDEDKIILSPEMLECLKDEPAAYKYFAALPPSHKNWFSNWVKSAKTDITVAKRISIIVKACTQKMSFSEMMKAYKDDKKLIQ